MKDIVQRKQGGFFWLQCSLDYQDTSRPLSLLLQNCPEVLLNNHVVVSALDSGPLQLTKQQIEAGWQRHGKLAASPRIVSVADLPFEWFDEWFIFNEPSVPTDVEVFVNYGTFSLGDPNPTIKTMYIGSDAKIEAQLAGAVLPVRQRFWAQLERINPTSYLANGNCFIFVTSDADLFQCVGAVLRSL